MLERQLSRLIEEAGRRTRGDNPLPWAIIWASATLMRRSLVRDDVEVQRITVREGQEITVSLHERDE